MATSSCWAYKQAKKGPSRGATSELLWELAMKIQKYSICLHVPEQAIQQKGRFSLGPHSLALPALFSRLRKLIYDLWKNVPRSMTMLFFTAHFLETKT